MKHFCSQALLFTSLLAVTSLQQSTTCYAPVTPFPKGYNCEVQGSLKKPVPYTVPTSGPTTFQQCRDACLSTNAVSFGFKAATAGCQCYKQNLVSQSFRASKAGAFEYANRHCYTATQVDTTSDPNNCGACGTVCGNGLSCVSSQCVNTFSLQVSNTGISAVDGTIVVTNNGAALYVGETGTGSDDGYRTFYVDSNGILTLLEYEIPVVGYTVLSGDNYESVIAFNGAANPDYLICEPPSIGDVLSCTLDTYSQFAVDSAGSEDGIPGYYIFAANGNQDQASHPDAVLTVVAPIP